MKWRDVQATKTPGTNSRFVLLLSLALGFLLSCQPSQSVPEEGRLSPDALNGAALVDVKISPISVQFDKTAQGRRSTHQTITLQNDSANAVGPFEMSFSGASAGEFELVETSCNAELSAQETCSASVVFAPQNVGDHTATLHVQDKEANFLDVPLTGTANTRGTLVPSTKEWALPPRRSGEQQTTRLRLENVGDYRVTFDSIKLHVDGDVPMYQGFQLFEVQCPPVLLPKLSCSVALAHNRDLPASDNAKLVVEYQANDVSERLEVPMTATVQRVPSLRLEPPRFDFGIVPKGSSPTVAFQLSAEDGDPGATSEKFLISLVTNRKSAACEIVSNDCERNEIATGQSCVINVRRLATQVAESVPCLLKIDSVATKKSILVAPIQSLIEGATTEGLLAHWEFNQTSGNTLVDARMSFAPAPVRFVTEVYGGNVDAAIDPMPTWRAGHHGGALTFAKGGFVRVPYQSVMDPIAVQNEFTACTWILVPPLTSLSDDPSVVSSSSMNSTHEAFNLSLGNFGAVSFRFSPLSYGAQPSVNATDLNFNDGKWHHLCGSFDSQVLRIFFDGALRKESDGYVTGFPPVPHKQDIYIGARSSAQNNLPSYFVGSIDDVALWSRALPPEQIKRLFDTGF